MADLYLVIGERGEYSDHREWPVCVYTDKAKADEHVRLANKHEEARDIEAEFDALVEGRKPPKSPYDPDRCSDFGRATYRIWVVEMRTKLPVARS